MKVTFFNKAMGLILMILTVTSCKMTAQPGMSYSTRNKKAIKLYQASRNCYGQVNPTTGRRNLACAEEKAKKVRRVENQEVHVKREKPARRVKKEDLTHTSNLC